MTPILGAVLGRSVVGTPALSPQTPGRKDRKRDPSTLHDFRITTQSAALTDTRFANAWAADIYRRADDRGMRPKPSAA